MKRLIGLTGGIAAGKSTVSEYLRKKGYEIIDADIIAREIVQKGSVGLEKIIQTFGKEYLTENGELNRAKLGAAVFADKAMLKKLDKITLPLIAQRIDELADQSKEGIVFVDGATIIESGWADKFEQIWLVGCDEDLQLKRLCQRNNLSLEEGKNRIRSQMSLAEKKKYAHIYLDNNYTKDELYIKIDQALQAL